MTNNSRLEAAKDGLLYSDRGSLTDKKYYAVFCRFVGDQPRIPICAMRGLAGLPCPLDFSKGEKPGLRDLLLQYHRTALGLS
jgi:hypothetical protein